MPNESCYSCRFKNENYRSDITIGDFWGVKNGETGYNAYGSSIAFVHTDAGDKFINSLNNFSLFITEPEKALKQNPRYLTPTAHTNQKDKFKADFEKHGLFYAASKALTFKQKIIKLIPKKLILFAYRVIKR